MNTSPLKSLHLPFCLLLLTLFSLPAGAADTLEVWEAGAGDFEMYSGFSGVGAAPDEQSLGGTMVLGYGLSRRVSAYVATGLAANGNLAETETELNLGAFGCLLDSDHLDLELGLDMVAFGPEMQHLAVIPSFELNLDRAPDLAAYGAFLRGAAQITGPQPDGPANLRNIDLNLTFGSYLALGAGQQLLLEYDITIYDHPEPGAPHIAKGSLAVGWNAMLSENLELITEARWQLPQGDQDPALGLLAGVIATLPQGR